MKKMWYLLIMFLFLIGCDPIQGKLDFYNKSKVDVYSKTFFISDDFTSIDVKNSLIELKQGEIKKTESIVDMRSVFDRYDDSLLNVVIFKKYSFLEKETKTYKNHDSDSLLRAGDYMIKRYTYSELREKGWQVIYPDDGFEQGKPLVLMGSSKLKPKPSPKILKEKGIEDRWRLKDSI